MRHQIGYIALSLLAAAIAGCSSADTSSRSTNGGDPLTGALAKYNAAIVPLSNSCGWYSKASGSFSAGTLSVQLIANDIAQISVRAVDKAMLVNGQTCMDQISGSSNKGIATSSLIKRVVVAPASTGGLDGTPETVILDTRNGQFALAGSSASTTGISIDLGSGTGDIVAIEGSTGADAFGCTVAGNQDALGIKSATNKDVTFHTVSPGITYIFDLSDGNDTFSQNSCVGTMQVYGGLGNDVINAGPLTLTNDLFSGGTDPSGTDKDTLSYAARTSTVQPMVINLSASTSTVVAGINIASATTSTFTVSALTAGVSGEADTLVERFRGCLRHQQ